MPADRWGSSVDPRRLRRIPADLAAILLTTVGVTIALSVPIVRETPVRVPLVLVFVLFVPGYVTVAALYPERGRAPTDRREDSTSPVDRDDRSTHRTQPGIDGLERIALSVGLSAVIVPIGGLVLLLTPWGIGLIPVAVALSTFTLAMTALAIGRRWRVPEADRFRVPYAAWAESARRRVAPDDRADAALTLVLAFSVLLAAGSVGYAATTLPQEDEFSSVTLLTEDEGELVADEYPTSLEPDETEELVLEIDNHEGQSTEYTVIVAQGDDTGDLAELDRFEEQLDHGETWTLPHEFEPSITGDDLRIVWLVYLDGDVPDEPSTETAEYHVHLTLDGATDE